MPAAPTRAQLRGSRPATTPAALTANNEAPAAVEDVAASDEGELFVLQPNGDWLYKLQEEPEPLRSGASDPMAPPFAIRVSGRVYARHIRLSTVGSDGSNASTMFHLVAGMCNLPPAMIDRVSAKDYAALSSKVAAIVGNG